MNFSAVEAISRAVLYEGYLLYPYRASALKNRQRWMFGRLLPREHRLVRDGSESWRIQAECLAVGTSRSKLGVMVRFLQLMDGDRTSGSAAPDTIEREVAFATTFGAIADCPAQFTFAFEPQLEGTVTVRAVECDSQVFRMTVVLENGSPAGVDEDLDQALHRSLLSSHMLLRVQEGEFISLLDPPASCRTLATNCQNVGTWPVLVGPDAGKMMLCAPIILYDYPQVAAESPGDLFDGTEIDELLSLRIQTLTDAEKQEMSAAGEHTRAMLRRTESLAEDELLQLHGRLTVARGAPHAFQPGDRVRLRPRCCADALDLMIRGQQATIVAVERDFEDRIHLGVVVDDDPGRDLGIQGHPGHRFFYGVDEVEPL